MGTIKKGILGGFSGKVGTVIGSYWKGQSVMRSLPQSYNDAASPGQLTQRMRFSLSVKFLRPLLGVIREGYKSQSVRMSEWDVALRQVLLNCCEGTYPNVTLDAEKVLLAEGPLAPAGSVVISQSNGKAEFSWDESSMFGNASPDDCAVIVVYQQESGEAVYTLKGAERSTLTDSLALPTQWSGMSVVCYMGFASANGKVMSNCSFVGELTVA